MRLVATIALVAGLVGGYSWPVRHRQRDQERFRLASSTSIPNPPVPADSFYLNFATSAEQSAMGAECACTASVVAGSGSQVITDVRDGGALCTPGNWLTGISTGSMVWCPSNTPRVMSGDGTLKGVLAEAGGRNFVDHTPIAGTMGIDMSDWLSATACGLSAPTVSYPDAGLCPDGTLTATRVIVPAANTGCYSMAYYTNQLQNAAGFHVSGSAYLKGYSGDGGTELSVGGNVRRVGYNGLLWNRALVEDVVEDTRNFMVGAYPGAVSIASEPAADFFICGVQTETGTASVSHVSSYTPGVRDGDRLTATVNVPMMSDLRVTTDFLPEGAPPGSGTYIVDVGFDTGAGSGGMASHIGVRAGTTGVSCVREWSSQPDVASETGTAFVPYTSATAICLWDGTPDTTGQLVACLGNTCADAGTTVAQGVAFPSAYTVDFGGRQDNAEFKSQPDGIVRNVRIASTAQKSVALYGDSIVEERGIPQLVCRGEVGRQASFCNYGVSGYNIDQCASAWNTTVSHIRADPASAYRNYLLIQCGTNSLGIDAGFITDTLKGLLTDARDAGAHPIWSTIIPRDGHCEAVQTVNATMRAWCINNDIPYVETWANLLATRSDPCSGIVSAYQRDSVHLNDAGETAMTELWVWGNDGGTWTGFKQ